MIALAIVGGLLVTLLYTLNYHLGIAERHEFVTVASFLARDKMLEAEKNPAPSKGTFPEPYSSYSYQTLIKDSSFPGLYEMSVTVSQGGREVVFTELTTK